MHLNKNNTYLIISLIVAAFLSACANRNIKDIDRQEYTTAFTRGIHFEELVNKGEYIYAANLFNKQYDNYFKNNHDAHKASIIKVANNIRPKIEDESNVAYNNLQESSFDYKNHTTWKNTRVAIINGIEVYDDPIARIVIAANLPLDNRKRLGGLIQEYKMMAIRESAKAFSQYSILSLHGISQTENFFDIYPEYGGNKQVIVELAWPSIKQILSAKSPEWFEDFYNKYFREIIADDKDKYEKLNAEAAEVYIDTYMKTLKQDGVIDLQDALVIYEKYLALQLDKRIINQHISFYTEMHDKDSDFDISYDSALFNANNDLEHKWKDGLTKSNHTFLISISNTDIKEKILDKKSISSTYISGSRTISNPDYEKAVIRLQQLQNGLNNALANLRNASQNSQSMGMMGIAVVIAARNNADEWNNAYQEQTRYINSMPTTIEQSIISKYEVDVTKIQVSKEISGHFVKVDSKNRNMSVTPFTLNSSREFRLGLNVSADDTGNGKTLDSKNDIHEYEKTPYIISSADLRNIKMQKEQSLNIALIHKVLTLNHRKEDSANNKENIQLVNSAADENISKLFKSIAVIHTAEGMGSGFYVGDDLILTNYHVISGNKYIEIELHDGKTTFGKVEKYDIEKDLALIRSQARSVGIKFYKDKIILGSTVYAIGHPKGLKFTVTKGIVSAVRDVSSSYQEGTNQKNTYVQTDAPISPGNSGGPLLYNDKVIGINTQKIAGGDSEGLGFALYSKEIEAFLTK